MSILLRANLILVCMFTLCFVIKKVRKSQMQIGDTVFWVCFAVFLFTLSIFPVLATYAANLLGVDAPVNFIFLTVIFVLLIKLFRLSIQLSLMESKLIELVQHIALDKVAKDVKDCSSPKTNEDSQLECKHTCQEDSLLPFNGERIL